MRIFGNKPPSGRVRLNDTRKIKEKIVFRSSPQKRVDTSFTEDNLVGANNRKDLRKVFHSSASKLATHHEIDPIHNRDIDVLELSRETNLRLTNRLKEIESTPFSHRDPALQLLPIARINLAKQDYIRARGALESIKDHESRVPFSSGIISIARAVLDVEELKLSDTETKALVQRGIESLNTFRDSELANSNHSGQLLRNVVANLFLGDYHEAEKILEPLIDFRDAEQKDKFYAKALYYKAFIEREQGKDNWEQTLDKAIEALGIENNKVFSYEERHLLFLLRKFQAFKEKNPEIESFVSGLERKVPSAVLSPLIQEKKSSPLPSSLPSVLQPVIEIDPSNSPAEALTGGDLAANLTQNLLQSDLLTQSANRDDSLVQVSTPVTHDSVPVNLADDSTPQMRSYMENRSLQTRLKRLTPGSPEWLEVYREMKPGDLVYEKAVGGKEGRVKSKKSSKVIGTELQEIIDGRIERLQSEETADRLIEESKVKDVFALPDIDESIDKSVNRETVFDIPLEDPQQSSTHQPDALIEEIDRRAKFFGENQLGSPEREASLAQHVESDSEGGQDGISEPTNPQPIGPSNLDETIETVSKSLAESIASIYGEGFQELEQKITLINQQLVELRTLVGSSEASVVAARETILKGLQLSLEEITSKFADLLKNQTANHEQNIEVLSRRIAKTGELLAKSVSAIVERLDNLSQADSASGQKIQELEKQLKELSSSFDQLKESINPDTTTQELKSLAQRIKELTQRIDNLPETVSSPVNNSQEIADLRELVESLKQQLKALQDPQPSKEPPTTPPDDSAIRDLTQRLEDAIERIETLENIPKPVIPDPPPAPSSSSITDHTEEIKDLNAKLTTVTQQLTDEKAQAKDNKKKQDIFQIVGGSLALLAAGASGYSLMQSVNAQNSLQVSLAALQNPSSGGLSVGLPATT